MSTTVLPTRFVNVIKTLALFSEEIIVEDLNAVGDTIPTFTGPLSDDGMGETVFDGAYIDENLVAVLRGESMTLARFMVITGYGETEPNEIHLSDTIEQITDNMSSDAAHDWVCHVDLDTGEYGFAVCKWTPGKHIHKLA